MTKTEFIAKLAEKLDIPKKLAAENADAVIDLIAEVVKAGDKISFPGFGTFAVSERAARVGRNPQTGAAIEIAASKSGKFTAGSGLKNL